MKLLDLIPFLTFDKKFGNRSDELKNYLKEVWEIETIVLNSQKGVDAFALHKEYLKLKDENCRMYDQMKDKFILLLGEDTANDIVRATRYFWRTPLMKKRKLIDKVAEGDYLMD